MKKISKKLLVTIHARRPFSANAFMLSNDIGIICGGNAMVLIPYGRINELTYPTIFKSRREARQTALLLGRNV